VAARKHGKSERARKPSKRVELRAEILPRRTLQDAEGVARALHREFASQATNWHDLARVLELNPNSVGTKYLIWAAQAYGLVTRDGNEYLLSETGRKVVAPTYDGEDREARIKALLTPSLSSKFYTDYNAHPFPSPQHFPNLLETKYQVPRERVDEVREILLSNARYADIIRLGGDGNQEIALSGFGAPTAAALYPSSEGDATQGAADTSTTDWDKIVFVITPIGDEGSEARKHSDMMLKHLLDPVFEEFQMQAVRADKIEKSGLITKQVFEHLAYSRLCVADLSFNNPNAFYELGVRHVIKRPTIQMIRKGDRIPFDVAQGRTITVDTSDVYTVMDRLESARRELREHVRCALSPDQKHAPDDNPVQSYLPRLRVSLEGAE